jgi:hypothetical protein
MFSASPCEKTLSQSRHLCVAPLGVPMAEHDLSSSVTDNLEQPAASLGLPEEHLGYIRQIERLRRRPGQLTEGLNGEVGERTLKAAIRALGASGKPRQFVVAAPPGTGKTSHASALLAAWVRISKSDPHGPYGGLFVVDQIHKAEETYKHLEPLLGSEVAVFTSDHDAESSRPPSKIARPKAKFCVEELEQAAVLIVTQETRLV